MHGLLKNRSSNKELEPTIAEMQGAGSRASRLTVASCSESPRIDASTQVD